MDPDTRANILSMALGAAQLDLERANMRLADAEGHKRRVQDRDRRMMRWVSLEHQQRIQQDILETQRRLDRMVAS